MRRRKTPMHHLRITYSDSEYGLLFLIYIADSYELNVTTKVIISRQIESVAYWWDEQVIEDHEVALELITDCC